MLSARKISGSLRFVISSVLDGGVGSIRGGMVERSIDMLAFLDSRDVGLEAGGDVSDNMLVIAPQLTTLYRTAGSKGVASG